MKYVIYCRHVAFSAPPPVYLRKTGGCLAARRKKSSGIGIITIYALIAILSFIAPIQAAPLLKKLEQAAGNVTDEEIQIAMESRSESSPIGGYQENPTVLKCFSSMEYVYTGGRYQNEPIRFRFHSPSNVEPGKKYPLIVWLHGGGESGSDNTRQLSHMQTTAWMLAGRREIPCFMIIPQCPADNPQWAVSISTEGDGDSMIVITRKIIDAVLEEYPIDPNRIGLFGICSGGSEAMLFAEKYPELFAAVVPCSSGYFGNASLFVHTSVWAFNNADYSDGGKSFLRLAAQMKGLGATAYVTRHESGGHNAWTGAMRDNAVAWLTLQNRNGFSPPPGVCCRFWTKAQQWSLFGLPLFLIAGTLACRLIRVKRTRREYTDST